MGGGISPFAAAPGMGGSSAADPRARLAEIRGAALAFEGMFLGILFKAMRGTAGDGGIAAGGAGERTFRGLLDEAYGRAAAGTTGIAAIVERQIARAEGIRIDAGKEERWTGTRSFVGRPGR